MFHWTIFRQTLSWKYPKPFETFFLHCKVQQNALVYRQNAHTALTVTAKLSDLSYLIYEQAQTY